VCDPLAKSTLMILDSDQFCFGFIGEKFPSIALIERIERKEHMVVGCLQQNRLLHTKWTRPRVGQE
jgi:hypothetical protein